MYMKFGIMEMFLCVIISKDKHMLAIFNLTATYVKRCSSHTILCNNLTLSGHLSEIFQTMRKHLPVQQQDQIEKIKIKN